MCFARRALPECEQWPAVHRCRRNSKTLPLLPRSERDALPGMRKEELFDFQPVVHAQLCRNLCVVGGSEEHALTGEAFEVARHVVDEVVGMEDALVSAKDEMGGREERKVPPQPAI